jgi:hypothetical protein
MGFWVNSVDHLPIYIYIDGVLKDSLLCGWIGGEPTCGVDTFIYTNVGYIRCTSNIPMPVGKYKVKAVGRDGTVWEKTVKLSENCVNVMISGPN